MNPHNNGRLNFLRTHPVSRRKFVGLGTAAVAGMAGMGAPFFAAPKKARAAANPIPAENQKPGAEFYGAGGWAPTYNQADYENDIRGYASATSVNIGGTIKFYIHVKSGGNYTIDIFRVGWYGGKGARLVKSVASAAGFDRTATTPTPDATLGYFECSWPESYSLSVPTDWVSGFYLAKIIKVSNGKDSYIPFVVRDDAREADLLIQSSFSTFQAYNTWVMQFKQPNGVVASPDTTFTKNTAGKSLYGDPVSYLSTVNTVQHRRAYTVSFDRPYYEKGAGDFPYFEYYWVRWLEKEGYNVKYCTNLDVHANPNLPYVSGSNPKVANVRAFLSIGHDEYWSKEMFDNVQAWRDAGLHIGFFSANTAYWQVRLYPNAQGVPNRRMVCYKDRESLTVPGQPLDPLKDPIANPPSPDATEAQRTTRFRDLTAPYTRPENQLLGVMFEDLVNWGLAFPLTITNANHWLFKNTGLYNGERIKGLVGYEWDTRVANGYEPEGLTVLTASSVYGVNEGVDAETSHSTIYQAKSGAYVFAAGTIYWSFGLDFIDHFQPRNYVHPGIQKLTRNILNTFINTPTKLLS